MNVQYMCTYICSYSKIVTYIHIPRAPLTIVSVGEPL
jgi:hypothetical protein